MGERHKIYAMQHRYGIPTFFITVSKESSTSPVTVLIGSRQFEDQNLKMNEVWDSTTSLSRRRAVAMAPATCAEEYDQVARAVLSDLFGCGLSDERRADSLPGKVPSGLLGEILAFLAITEAQARGSLHMYALSNSKIRLILFSRLVHNPAAVAMIRDWIDPVVSAELPQSIHERLLQSESERSEHPPFPIDKETLMK